MKKDRNRKWDADWDRLRLETKVNRLRDFVNRVYIETKEGIIGSAESSDCIALLEVNAETDFVTQNERFRQFVKDLCSEAASSKPSNLEAFLKHQGIKYAPPAIDLPPPVRIIRQHRTTIDSFDADKKYEINFRFSKDQLHQL